ncbi:hypothetical protein BsWGS_15722 [Bradybaena similaris]
MNNLNVSDTSTGGELVSDLLEHESRADLKHDLDLPECEETQTSSLSEHLHDSDSEIAHSESSDIEESNGFQKVKLTIVSKVSPDTELDESNGFHKLKLEDTSANTPEAEIEDLEDDYGKSDCFQNIKFKDKSSNAKELEVEAASKEHVPGTSVQNQTSRVPTNVTDVEITDQANVTETVKACETEEFAFVPSSHAAEPFIQVRPTEGCMLRHRGIDPEPSQKASDGHKANDLEAEITPKGSKEKMKIALIRAALESDPVDIASLRKLAISPGGLVNKNMRQRVWPLLIGANTTNITPKPSQEEMEAYTKTYSQVVMDVNRSSSRFPPGIDDHVRMSMKDKLVDLIMRVMLKHPKLKYYQGFHDVCITFLLCMDEDLAFAMVEKLALGYMREYLDESMERTSLLLNFVYPLVNKCNPELCAHMQRNDLGTIFALSWVITWFSHVLGDIKRILRVFDFFLASHRMMPVYLSAAFVLYREQDIYAAGDEMGYIHKCLSTIPSDLPLESLLQRAGDLYLQYPPTEISQDPMLICMNKQVHEHFNRIDNRAAARRAARQSNDRGRLFVKATLWAVTAVVGVAAAVLYHSYMGQHWSFSDIWGSST